MAYSAALYMEVRWRLLGSDEAWSEPRRVSPVREVVVEELDRTKQYEFEARNVSACGAKSDWVLVSHTVPDISPDNIRLDDLKTEVTNAANDAAQANADLARIASDNMLTIGEKPTVIRDYNVIVTEQAGIDGQATAFSITTEKATYDAKVTALVDHMATLTSPVLWSDLTGDTTIDGPTLRTVFADVYTSRQALLNKIYAAAKALADKAQQDVDDLAAEQYCYNPTFRIGLSGWTSVYNGAGFYTEAGANSPDPNTETYLVREGQASPFVVLMENTGGGLPVHEGQGVTASIALRAITTNASALAYVRIEWLDKDRTSIGNASQATGICSLDGGDGHFSQGVSRVRGTAPAGACYAVVTVEYDGHTSGIFTATKASIGYTTGSLDEVDDGTSYLRGVAWQGAAASIPNNTFQMALDSAGKVPGWTCPAGYGGFQLSTAAVQVGKQSLLLSAPTGGLGVLQCDKKFKVLPGDDVYVGGWVYPISGFFASCSVAFFDANDNFIAPICNAGTSTAAWAYLTNHAKAPAGAAYFVLQLRLSGGTSATSFAYFNEIDCRINDLRVSGSGVRLGDMRNQVMVGVGSFGAGWSGGALTCASSNLSATITMGAATLKAGGASIAYNQASTSVSIAGPNTTGKEITYHLYLDDDTYSGGSKSLHATTSDITTVSADGRVYVGKILVHYPASGTSSGSGSSPCPDEDAWVLRADPNGIRPDWPVRAKAVRAGHFLRLTDGTPGLVSYSERKPAPRVRVSAGGRSLTCSTSAPLELAGTTGECVLAPESLGSTIKALASGAPCSVEIDDVKDAGNGWVQHITCQDACFWTGDDPEFLFGHHNMKQVQ